MNARRITTIAAVSAAFAAAAPAGAQAADFAGSCSGTGDNHETVPIGMVPHPTTHVATGTGRCSGVLDGASVRDLPVRYSARLHDVMSSCASGQSDEGTVEIDFGGGRVKAYAQRSVLPVAGFLLTGPEADGMFTAYLELPRQDPANLLRCALGTLDRYLITWTLATH